jgi:2,4-dienoyl-CoA reductase-like NADH-dependent reductase (Old Yellow Enzyme family)
MQFGIDLVTATRAFVGPDFPILFRLGVLEKDGRVDPDSITYARELVKAGVDCLNISTGGFAKTPVTPGKKAKMGTLVFLAEAIKPHVNIPVIAVGKINTPEIAEEILKQGRADMVAIGRQLIADPFWPKKVLEDRLDEIVACDACNINCSSSAFKRNLPEDAPLCRYNVRVGKEWEIPAPE